MICRPDRCQGGPGAVGVQRTDGEWADRSQFLDHIAHLRTLVATGEVEVYEGLHDGDKYADQHSCHFVMKDGTTVSMEVYVFADMAPTAASGASRKPP